MIKYFDLINEDIIVPIYFSEEDGKKVYDVEEMTRDFENKLKEVTENPKLVL